MQDGATDRPLIEASLRGEVAAFARLVERHQGLVCAVTLAATCDRAASEDLAQETFITAWRSLPQLREHDNFRGWLCGIARNLSRAMRRRAGREAALEHEDAVHDTSPAADEVLEAGQSEALVWRVLAEIPETYREPLILYYRQGRSAQEVADHLGVTVAAVEQRLSRGRKYLRAEVERRIEDALDRSRPSSRLTAAIVAALPPVPAGAATAAPTAAVTTQGTTMLKIIAGTAALTAAVSGAALCSTDGTNEPDLEHASRAADEHTHQARPREMESRTAAELADARAAAAARTGLSERATTPYELMRLGPGQVALDLDGGPSTLVSGADFLGLEPVPEKPVVRTIRGRVLDGGGQAVEGAVIIAGRSLTKSMLSNALTGQLGAVTNAAGAFTLESTDEDSFLLLALHHEAGWSPIAIVEAGREGRRLDLTLAPPGTVTGQVTRGGEGLQAHAVLRLLDENGPTDAGTFRMMFETDAAGRLNAPLPLGRYDVSIAAGPARDIAVGARYHTRKLEVEAARPAQLEIDLPSGAMLLASARWPEEWDVQTVTYQWLHGRHAVAEPKALKALADTLPTSDRGYLLVGGVDLHGGVQFVDVASGEVTVCAHAEQRRESIAFACSVVSIESAADARELEIDLSAARVPDPG